MFKLLKIIVMAVCLCGAYMAFENYTKTPTEPKTKTPVVATSNKEVKKEQTEQARIDKHTKSAIKHLILAVLPDQKEWPMPIQRTYTAFNLDEIVDPIKENPNWVDLDEMAEELPQALIAIEDHKFYEHGPIAVSSIARAAFANIVAGEITQGGSTITQQLVKNICLTSEQSLERKLTEAFLAIAMEETYSKNEILELYLNTVYLGAGADGVKQAAWVYFEKSPSQLNLAECAVLAALPNAPSALNPLENPKGCRKRQLMVLDAMAKHGFITAEQCQRAKKTKVILSNDESLE